jgi:hypothetical protein
MTCYRFGQHFKGPKPLNEQILGWTIQQRVLETAFHIVERSQPDDAWLGALQAGLQAIPEIRVAPLDFRGQRLIFYYYIHMIFVDDGMGGGHVDRDVIARIAADPRQGKSMKDAWASLEEKGTKELTDAIFMWLESIQYSTPLELHRGGRSVGGTMRKMAVHNVFLLSKAETYEEYYHRAYSCEALKDALVVVTAIMHYQLEEGDFPAALDQLVRKGYLDALPTDPFSGSSFVYKEVDGDFLLYSLGPDFDDDGGTRMDLEQKAVEGDMIFWPVREN